MGLQRNNTLSRQTLQSSVRKGQLIKLAGTFSMSVMAIGVKYAFEAGAHLVEVLLFRTSLSLPWILLWALLSRQGIRSVLPKHWSAQLTRVILGICSVSLAFTAIQLLPIAEASVLLFLSPLFGALFAILLLKEKAHIKQGAALIAGLTGVIVVAQPGGDSLPALGVLAGLGGAVSMGLVAVTLRGIAQKEAAIATTFCFAVACSTIFGIFYPWYSTGITSDVLLVLAVSAFFGSTGQFLLTLSYKYAPVSDLAALEFTNIVWAILLSFLVWQILPPFSTWIGATIIVAGSFLIMRAK